MMPFHLHDPVGTLPDLLGGWRSTLNAVLKSCLPTAKGTGYLTIDEAWTVPGVTHRRPGLHVDGWADDGQDVTAGGSWGGGGGGGGGWGGGGGGGGGWGGGPNGEDVEVEPASDKLYGMLMMASHTGCRAWHKDFVGNPVEFGDCEHLRDQFPISEAIELLPCQLYHMNGMTVHESIPIRESVPRQFMRISMPSKSAWHSSCTPNPLGILPDGPIVKPRPVEFTNYHQSRV